MRSHYRWRFGVPALLCLLAVFPAQAQNRDPITAQLSGPTADSSRAFRSSDEFIIGWNWGQIPKRKSLSDSLFINAVHTTFNPKGDSNSGFYDFLRQLPDDVAIVPGNSDLSQGSYIPYAWAIAIEFDPTLGVTTEDPGAFRPRYKDTTAAVYGFAVRNFGQVPPPEAADIEDHQQHLDYDRYIIEIEDLQNFNQSLGLPLSTPQLVLAAPSPDNELIVGGHYSKSKEQKFIDAGLDAMIIKDRRVDNSQIVYNGVPLERWMDTTIRGGDTTLYWRRNDTTEWYVSINLRRYNNDDGGGAADDPVLALRVPYIVRTYDRQNDELSFDTLLAVFDSVSVAGNTITDQHYGIMDRDLQAVAGSPTEFYITKEMLPAQADTLPNNSVTLSAYFKLPPLWRNSRFDAAPGLPAQPLDPNDPYAAPSFSQPLDSGADRLFKRGERIQSAACGPDLLCGVERVQPEVVYHGRYSVAIDWLRLESRLARQILRGGKDSLVAAAAQRDYDALDALNGLTPQWRGLKLLRHYLADETTPAYWRVQRHLSTLLDSAGTQEGQWIHTLHYAHQAKSPDIWRGWIDLMPGSAAPWLRYGDGGVADDDSALPYGHRSHRCMGLKYGYRRSAYPTPGNDLNLDFDYETALIDVDELFPLFDRSEEDYAIVMDASSDNAFLQARYEWHSAREFYRYSSGFFDTTRPVWFNPWVHVNWRFRMPDYSGDQAALGYRDSVLVFKDHRPKTGEEFDLYLNTAIAHGVKGLFYFKGGSGFPGVAGGSLQMGVSRSNLRGDPDNDGGDFLDDRDPHWNYLDRSALAHSMGLDSSNPRFYVGSATTRAKMRRLNQWIADNNDELMRLQLLNFYNKGFKALVARRDSLSGIENFLDTNLSPERRRFALHRLHDRRGHDWTGPEEAFKDSTFFLLSVLKDAALGTDSIWYLCAVNRRTDPTIHYPDGTPFGGGTDLGDSIKFFSTLEFESLLDSDQLGHYAEPAYAQHGARAITIPFDYSHPDFFVYLRVQEVGGGLDTTIRQDQDLCLNFRPGEGRLLRIRVIKPDLTAAGSLAYSNQRKLIAAPLADSSIVYHMVYHRELSGAPGSYGVFYRRSLPLTQDKLDEKIEWSPGEVYLSNALVDFHSGSSTPDTMRSCAYPSLVVRKDANGIDWVYVVYACQGDNESLLAGPHSLAIGESIFRADALPDTIPDLACYLATAAGHNLDEWGTPVINASAQGNFYAWADSLQGIATSYKTPEPDAAAAGPVFVSWSTLAKDCKHPSLNSYSRPEFDQNDCGLAWEERNVIYYTRLRLDTNSGLTEHFLADSLRGSVTMVDPARRMIKLSEACYTNRLPKVYRNIDSGGVWVGNIPVVYLFSNLDQVFWEARADSGAPMREIHHSMIGNGDLNLATLRGPWWVTVHRPGRLRHLELDLFQPNASQGGLQLITDHFNGSQFTVSNHAEDAVILNYIAAARNATPGSESELWHLPLPLGNWTSFMGAPRQITEYEHRVRLSGKGQQPQLAARRYLTDSLQINENRRIYEQGTQPQLAASVEYFYKETETPSILWGPSFFESYFGCTRRRIHLADVKKNDGPILFRPSRGIVFDTLYNPPTLAAPGDVEDDSVFTDWFTVAQNEMLTINILGKDTSFTRLDLVKQSDGSRSRIPLTPGSDTSSAQVKVTLLNGGNSNYRLEFYATTTSANLTQDIVFGPLTVATTSYARAAAEQSLVINLAEGQNAEGDFRSSALRLAAWPNPADDLLSVAAWSERSLGNAADGAVTLLLVDPFGRRYGSWSVIAGTSINIPLGMLGSGAYFLRATQRYGARSNELDENVIGIFVK